MGTCYPADYIPAITYLHPPEAHGRVSGAPGSHKLVEVVWVRWPVEPRGSAMEGSPITLLSRVHLVGNIHETDHSLHSLRESMPPRPHNVPTLSRLTRPPEGENRPSVTGQRTGAHG